MRRIRHDQQGFTLLELVIVLMIALFLAALAVPTYKDLMARHRLNAATVQLMSDFMLARKRSLSQQHSVQILFNKGERQTYRIWDDIDNDNSRSNRMNRAEIKPRNVSDFGVKMKSNNSPRFFPSGSVTKLPTVRLRHPALSKRDARCITISITGRIRQKDCIY